MPPVDEQHALSPFPVLHGLGLRLRPWDARSETDVANWLRGLTDPDFRRWNTPLRPVTDLESAHESLSAKTLSAVEGTGVSYCVTDAGSGTVLGHIGLNLINHALSNARVGYWVLPEARGRGVATRAVRLLADWAREELGLTKIEVLPHKDNAPSRRVAEKAGFVDTGALIGSPRADVEDPISAVYVWRRT